MPSIVRTFTSRINTHPVLAARAELESRIERRLYVALRSGRKFTGDLAVSFYQQFGISAKTLDGIHRQLKAKLASISELMKLRTAEIEVRFAAKLAISTFVDDVSSKEGHHSRPCRKEAEKEAEIKILTVLF
ncbi:hypothetical protein [Bradyrhizobium vignae]|uniref:Uncharacterized protein n=1 Tax=Bradyrhizobium vignae TaxID=1549949 RepID=A0A2U3PV29_9BRAD|nr:hypothetical protein [Bradyrhizobium vignae]SPP93010.1 protein of unknown function [Bradyrhizobium vignae]